MKVRRTELFDKWLRKLKDKQAKVLITSRLQRLAFGHLGDSKPVGNGVHELRIHVGPGYRLYYTRHGDEWILLLMGGNKGSQARDIKRAKQMVKDYDNQG